MAEAKEVKKSVPTIASTFQRLAVKGAASRKELAKAIIKDLKDKGVTTNVKNKPIREERVLQQISAMLRDIKNERGKSTKSWWSTYTIVEDEKELKLVARN